MGDHRYSDHTHSSFTRAYQIAQARARQLDARDLHERGLESIPCRPRVRTAAAAPHVQQAKAREWDLIMHDDGCTPSLLLTSRPTHGPSATYGGQQLPAELRHGKTMIRNSHGPSVAPALSMEEPWTSRSVEEPWGGRAVGEPWGGRAGGEQWHTSPSKPKRDELHDVDRLVKELHDVDRFVKRLIAKARSLLPSTLSKSAQPLPFAAGAV